MNKLVIILKGGSGSGDWGHTGRAGKRGGSGGGGGGKGRPRKGRRSREALNKEIEAGEKPKTSPTNSRVTNDVRNLEFDRNIEKLHTNFDANRSIIGKPNKKTIDKISKSAADVKGFVMKTSIPVSKIFSMSSSGPGTSDQREMTVIGDGSKDEVFISWAN